MKTDMREYMRERRLKRRQTLLNMSGNRCSICGSTENLEFDHVNRSDKSFNLSGCYLDRSWKSLLEEYYKCSLLCRTCHNTKTTLCNDRPFVPWNKNVSAYFHGYPRTYQETGCRCTLCKKAKRLYRKGELGYNVGIVE